MSSLFNVMTWEKTRLCLMNVNPKDTVFKGQCIDYKAVSTLRPQQVYKELNKEQKSCLNMQVSRCLAEL
jgi:hypothetical protein